MTGHPTATVLEHRCTIGHVHMLEVACPHGKHTHHVGVTDTTTTTTTTLWCSHGAGHYTVTLEEHAA